MNTAHKTEQPDYCPQVQEAASEAQKLRAENKLLRLRVGEYEQLFSYLPSDSGCCLAAEFFQAICNRMLENLFRLRELGEFYSQRLFVKQMADALEEMDREKAQGRRRSRRVNRRYYSRRGKP